MPVTYYSQLMTFAFGGSAAQAGLDGPLIQPAKLQENAETKLRPRRARRAVSR